MNNEPLKDVSPKFTPTKSGASSIVLEYDERSSSYEQIALGIFLAKIKSNNNALIVEKLSKTDDGHEFYEIKVMGS